jgi:hypothetical protein
MLPIQILQQHLPIPIFPLVPTHIIAPAADRASQPPRHIWLLANLRDGQEIRADGEDDATGAGEPVSALAKEVLH